MKTTILSKQNYSENIKLLKASSVAYNKAKRVDIFTISFLLFLSVAYPICYLFIKEETTKLILFGCSFLLTLLIQIFASILAGNTSKGAILKEEFDTIIFGLPWKSTIKKLERREVLSLAQQYKGPEIFNWYSNNLSESVGHNISVAVLQHTNTSWDIELRKIFRRYLINFLVCYSILLFTSFVLKNVDAQTIFLTLFSLLPFYTHFISLIRGHSSAIEKREAISLHLDDVIRNKKNIGTNELRDIQDEIHITRQEAAKVPNVFFHLYKERLNSEIEEYISEINMIYNA